MKSVKKLLDEDSGLLQTIIAGKAALVEIEAGRRRFALAAQRGEPSAQAELNKLAAEKGQAEDAIANAKASRDEIAEEIATAKIAEAAAADAAREAAANCSATRAIITSKAIDRTIDALAKLLDRRAADFSEIRKLRLGQLSASNASDTTIRVELALIDRAIGVDAAILGRLRHHLTERFVGNPTSEFNNTRLENVTRDRLAIMLTRFAAKPPARKKVA